MLHLCSSATRFQIGLLQLEVPLRGTVRIIDQHEVRIVLQSLSLILHRLAILLNKFREYKLQQPGPPRQPAKDVPCRDHVDSTMAAGDRSDGRQTGEPVLARLYRLHPQVWKNKVDRRADRGRIGIEP